ncbi:MAG TPA: YhjD/YihY/BrkB family envelope integrity protein [Nitriliruptoraceae bacterium]|nr:YhjD/YihY/BrkB family envelope integrity protein [Nitriliruptoraceae bacterium]
MTFKERLAAVPVVGTLMAVQKRTKADAADQFGAAIAFHGFISLFPLIAVAVAIAGWLLADQPEQIANVVEAIQEAVPGLQSDAIDEVLAGIIDNAGTLGIIGFLGALYTGLRVTTAAQTATQFVFGVRLENVNALKARAQQLGALALLGTMALASVAMSAWVQSVVLAELSGQFAGLVPFGAWLASAFFDVLLFWTAYRIYSAGAGLGWRSLLPGAIAGGVGWAALQYFGGSYLARSADSSVITDDGSTATAVLLATMIGLMLLFYLAGRLYVYGAELSAVMAGVPDRDQRDAAHEREVKSMPPGTPAPVRADEHASGDQQGLLAALTAHEQRRGLASPDDTGSLFPVDASTDQGDPGAGADSSDGAVDHAVSSAVDPGTATTDVDADAPADADGRPRTGGMAAMVAATMRGRRGRDADAEVVESEHVDEDMVVTISHEPDPEPGPTPDSDPDSVPTSHRASPFRESAPKPRDVPAAAMTASGAMTRELVPFDPATSGSSSLIEDPRVRRVAAAAAIGLVGLAVGAMRWRREG